jgi:hypothetical protein
LRRLLLSQFPEDDVSRLERQTKRENLWFAVVNSELKHAGRQLGDDSQNKFLQINDSKENFNMNLIQYKKLKTLALCLGRVLLNRILSCTCYALKCRHCINDVKICDLSL